MTSWIVYSVITSVLLTVAALGAEGILRSARRPARAVWFIAILLAVGFTATAPLRSTPQMVLDLSGATMVQSVDAVEVRETTRLEALKQSGALLLQRVTRPLLLATDAAASVPASVDRVAKLAAVASSVVALCVLVAVYGRSMRERLRWPRITLLGQNVRLTPDVGPAVLGLAPPEIVVPQWVLLRNADEQQLVLAHESEHVRAHDPLLLLIACAAVACMPWNPAAWFMLSRLRLAVELDCDRRVLLRGVQKPAYGQLLVELSSSRPWMSPAIPAFSWGTSHLEQRLVAMTSRPKRYAVLRRVVNGVVVATAIGAAARAEMPAPQTLQAMDVSHLTVAGMLAAPQVVSQDTITRKKDRTPPATVQKRATTKPAARNKVQADSTPPAVVRYNTVVAVDSASPQQRVRIRAIARDSGVYVFADSSGRRQYNTARIRSDSSVTATLRTDSLIIVDGVVVRPDSAGSRVRIRSQGNSSGTSANDPLIFVDGVLMGPGTLQQIKPSDIESVEVIKGAAAVSVFGPTAVNGVITIKLKRP